MHEVSLVESLFDAVDAAIGAHPRHAVEAVTVRIGELAGVEVTLFETAFVGLAGERGYPRAQLTVEREAASWECPECGSEARSTTAGACERCGGPRRPTGGAGIVLTRVELEVR
jgi:Zn finger protein HypA/HybF involved in hydrogenase expression